MRMIRVRELLSVSAAALVAGCATVELARERQSALAEKGSFADSVSAPADFRGWSLERLVGFAMTNRPSMTAAALAAEDAHLALKALRADAPLVSDSPWTAASLSARGGYSEASAGATRNYGDFRTSGSPSASLSLELLVWDFGRYDARSRAAAERVIAAEQALSEAGYQVFGEVANGFFDFMEARACLEVARTNESQYAAHLVRSEERLKAGEAAKLDVLRSRLDLANARQATVAASNTVVTAGATLMCALGVDASRGTAEEAFGRDELGVGCVYRAFDRTRVDAAETFAFARTNAPSVCVARARLRAASHEVDAAIAELYPTVSASVGLSWTDPLWVWNWGVSAFESLFEGCRRTTAVDRARVAMESAAVEVDASEQALSLLVEEAVARRDNSELALKSAVAAVRSARENLETVEAELSVGSVSRVELSEAVALDSTAVGDAIRAFYTGQRAEAALYSVMGVYPAYHEQLVREEVK